MLHRSARPAAVFAALFLGHAAAVLAAQDCSALLKLVIPGGSIQKAVQVPAGPAPTPTGGGHDSRPLPR